MRLFATLLSVVFLATAATANAVPVVGEAGPFEACDEVVNVRSNGYIYKNSAPLRSGGVGTPLVGYRKEPTLIMLRNTSNRKTTIIYAANGTRIGSCPWASAHDTFGGRFRCVMSTASLRKKAQKVAESTTVYFRLKPGVCVEVPDAGRCYGSVKGLCNQLIK